MAYYNNLFSLDGGPYVIGCRKCRRLKLFLDGFRNTSPIIIPSEISWHISNWAALSNLIVRARSVNDGRADCNVGDRATAAGPGNAPRDIWYTTPNNRASVAHRLSPSEEDEFVSIGATRPALVVNERGIYYSLSNFAAALRRDEDVGRGRGPPASYLQRGGLASPKLSLCAVSSVIASTTNGSG